MTQYKYTAPLVFAELSLWSPPVPVAALFSPQAPTASVAPSPESATELPNWSNSPVFEAFT
jgi:hypothetical protein